MNMTKRFLYQWMLAFIFFAPSFASAQLIWDDSQHELSGLGYIDYFIDTNSDLDIESVLKHTKWAKLNKSHLGFIKVPVWTRLELVNDSQRTVHLVLYNPRPNMDHIQTYIIKQNAIVETWTLGDVYSNETQPLNFLYSALPITLKPNEKVTLVSQLINNGAIEANWLVSDIKPFSYQNIQMLLIWGLIIGFAIMLVIFHLNLFLSLKVNMLISFVSLTLLGLTALLSLNGFFRHFNNFEDLAFYLNFLPWISYTLTLISLVWLTSSFLNTKQTMPIMHWFLQFSGLMLFAILAFFFYAIQFNGQLLLVNAFILLAALYALITPVAASIIAIQKKIIGAQFFFAAQCLFVAANMILIFTIYGLVAISQFISLVLMIAFAAYSTLFVFSINQQTQQIQKINHKQKQLLHTQSNIVNVGKLFGNVLHQAKLPLARLGSQICLIDGLNQNPDPSSYQKIQTLIPVMRTQMELLQSTMDDFKDFYSSPAKQQTTSLTECIQKVSDLLSGKFILSNTKMKTEILAPDTQIQIDEIALAHVLMILIDNALDMLLERRIENTELIIKTKYTDNQWRLEVEDQAGGILIKPIERIFDNFVTDKKKG